VGGGVLDKRDEEVAQHHPKAAPSTNKANRLGKSRQKEGRKKHKGEP
jgi:hypothetical protein